MNLTPFSPKRRRKTPLTTARTPIAPFNAWPSVVLHEKFIDAISGAS
jgi:hypothetical protein